MALLALPAGGVAVQAAGGRAAFVVNASRSERVVRLGDTAVFTIHVERRGAYDRPITLGIWRLPRGSRAVWTLSDGRPLRIKRRTRRSVVLPRGHRTVRLVVRTTRKTRLGRFKPRYSAMTPSLRRRGRLRLAVVRTTPEATAPAAAFGMRGTAARALAPGVSLPIDVELHNPHDFVLKVDRIAVTLDPAAGRPGCEAAANYRAHAYSGPYPIAVPPGSARLSELGIDASQWPRVEMLAQPWNQDACKGAVLPLRFEGEATR